ncbi:bifunctional enoyl-CoA hydratase/phosphate acetyltransferase [Acetobacter oeni]|uniref:Phosphate acetyl/butyryl transferase n=1 Tax=Acetobacter oeni TaxID=304077 RepID=A0A511XLU5_9PROT|nr:bifunctional enoyl-CoA hydratase/phosphate acetyltransferase [Acetobacter oeni]MBB3882960.1 phosphate acetyltransferase [Acetobacter oeni]NHO19040.1 bifunctional enoyl-CoA hydratase/phosphate acetyltransferase [Acetobacter oeni]GEN63920.1 phosphate acetyl/butyryl transferase [Acetobacter oeni]
MGGSLPETSDAGHVSPLTRQFIHDASEQPVIHKGLSHRVFEELISRVAGIPRVPTAVVWPREAHALEGALAAAKYGLIHPVLVGRATEIREVAKNAGLDLADSEIADVADDVDAAAKAVSMAREGRVQSVMKGSLHTDILMRAVVSAEGGLRTERRISHVFLLAAPRYDDLLFVTDAAINIFPDLDTKRDITQNAIDLHTGLGLGAPRVAILSAVEIINSKIPSTVDAACLCKMAERGQITGGVLEGPLAMDNAIDPEAARIKGIESPVAGRAQILVVPDLEAGNMLAKNLIFMGGATSAGIVLGARVPVILTSRADSIQDRVISAAIGALYGWHVASQKQDTQ